MENFVHVVVFLRDPFPLSLILSVQNILSTNIILIKIPFCKGYTARNLLLLSFLKTILYLQAADAINWLSFFLVSIATVSKEMVLLASLSTSRPLAGAEGISWSTASNMLLDGTYSINSSESSSSTTDSKTLERTKIKRRDSLRQRSLSGHNLLVVQCRGREEGFPYTTFYILLIIVSRPENSPRHRSIRAISTIPSTRKAATISWFTVKWTGWGLMVKHNIITKYEPVLYFGPLWWTKISLWQRNCHATISLSYVNSIMTIEHQEENLNNDKPCHSHFSVLKY